MGASVDKHRRMSRYAMLFVSVCLVSGSLNTEASLGTLDLIAKRNDLSAIRAQLALVDFKLRDDIKLGKQADTSGRLQQMARNTLAMVNAGREIRPAERNRLPEIEPLQFVTAAAMPPMLPELPTSAVTNGRRVASADGDRCAEGREAGFAASGCLVREVAWPLRQLPGDPHGETAPVLRELAGESSASDSARSAQLETAAPPVERP